MTYPSVLKVGRANHCSRNCSLLARHSIKAVTGRFWNKVAKSEGCWEWTASRSAWGYGKFGLGGRGKGWVFTHRFSYEIANGFIPQGFDVLHKCDNPPCVRPDHLFLGKDAENHADMVSKGRSNFGERHPLAKLTGEQVLEIRTLGKSIPRGRGRNSGGGRASEDRLTYKKLGEMFGISGITVGDILRGGSWTNLL